MGFLGASVSDLYAMDHVLLRMLVIRYTVLCRSIGGKIYSALQVRWRIQAGAIVCKLIIM
jgi:hypothetical protein